MTTQAKKLRLMNNPFEARLSSFSPLGQQLKFSCSSWICHIFPLNKFANKKHFRHNVTKSQVRWFEKPKSFKCILQTTMCSFLRFFFLLFLIDDNRLHYRMVAIGGILFSSIREHLFARVWKELFVVSLLRIRSTIFWLAQLLFYNEHIWESLSLLSI